MIRSGPLPAPTAQGLHARNRVMAAALSGRECVGWVPAVRDDAGGQNNREVAR